MKVTPESKLYAQAALDFLRDHPEVHNQETWQDGNDPTETKNFCGTTMCVGGTVNWLKHGDNTLWHESEYEGRDLLGLSYGEAHVVFYEMDNERVLNKLEKVARGEEFTEADFYRADENESENLTFDHDSWEMRDDYA